MRTFYVTLARPEGGVCELIELTERRFGTTDSFSALIQALEMWFSAGFKPADFRRRDLRVLTVGGHEQVADYLYVPTRGELELAMGEAQKMAAGPPPEVEDEGPSTNALLSYYDGDPSSYHEVA